MEAGFPAGFWRSTAGLVLAFTCGPSAWARQGPSPDVLSMVGQSIVRLSMVEGGEEQGNGTGFIVRTDGIVVTNHHVVDDATSAFVAILRDGTRRKVLGSLALDEEHDLALIRIEGGGYPALSLATPQQIHVGQSVFLIGSSSGLDQSLGIGIVSALRPDGFPDEWKKRYRSAGEKIVAGPIIQHTAASSPGSSGSPVVDLEGRVVAVHHSGIFGFPIYFGAHADALRVLLDRTNLDATPQAFGPSVSRNLLISAAVIAAMGALFAAPGLLRSQSRRFRGPPKTGWPKP